MKIESDYLFHFSKMEQAVKDILNSLDQYVKLTEQNIKTMQAEIEVLKKENEKLRSDIVSLSDELDDVKAKYLI